MKAADINTNLIDSYYTLLKSLSSDNKLELIARLSKSMKTTKKKEEVSLESLYGSFVSGQSAVELIEGLKKDRNFNRKRVDL
jgi:hypothetical protein